jgi:hypothetical protein
MSRVPTAYLQWFSRRAGRTHQIIIPVAMIYYSKINTGKISRVHRTKSDGSRA